MKLLQVLIESDWNLKGILRPAAAVSGAVLIESDWNLKSIVLTQSKKVLLRINRIRLEFKEKQKDWIRELNKVLIESDWNLKLERRSTSTTMMPVLIESDWNLKYYFTFHSFTVKFVLIESDWNLKDAGLQKEKGRRYVLIESDWNLKLFIFIILIQNSCSINRIRLEFKACRVIVRQSS